jgi:hypothetical protein
MIKHDVPVSSPQAPAGPVPVTRSDSPVSVRE